MDKLSLSDPISANKKIRNLHLDEMYTVTGERESDLGENGEGTEKTKKDLQKQAKQMRQDIRALRREFKRNQVDLAVKKNPETGYYTVFYGANDVNRAKKAFEKVLGKSVEKPKRPPMKERLAAAVKESERREAARAVEKIAERAVKAPAREAR